jgi:hypothetical protein
MKIRLMLTALIAGAICSCATTHPTLAHNDLTSSSGPLGSQPSNFHDH